MSRTASYPQTTRAYRPPMTADVTDVLALIEAAKPYLTDEYDKAIALGIDPVAAARALLGRADTLLAGMTVDA